MLYMKACMGSEVLTQILAKPLFFVFCFFRYHGAGPPAWLITTSESQDA